MTGPAWEKKEDAMKPGSEMVATNYVMSRACMS